MNRAERVAQTLVEIGAVGFSAQAPIIFKSGIRSPIYMDNRILPYHPQAWRVIIEGFAELLQTELLLVDALAGIAVAGIPHSAALGYTLGIPSLFIRKEAKEHGTTQRIEGGNVAEKNVILVEDLVTTGGSSLNAVAVLREAGARVMHCMAISSYGFEIAAQNFNEAGVRLHTLTDFDHIWAVASARVDEQTRQTVEAWHADPLAWE